MRWIAPPQKDAATSRLKARYSQPVLGLVFLRFADAKFGARRAQLAKSTIGRRGSRVDEPSAYHAKRVLYLPEDARFDQLLEFPEGGRKGQSLGKALDQAMRAIERSNPQLSGAVAGLCLRHVAHRLRRAELLHGLPRQTDAQPHADADRGARQPRLPE